MTSKLGTNRAFYSLLGVSFLLIFLFLSLISKIAPLTVSHVLYKCSEAMSGIAISLPHYFPPFFVLVVATFIFASLITLAIQIYKTQWFVTKLLKFKVSTPKRVKIIANELGLGDRIDVVNDDGYSSFCYGIFFPRICISSRVIRNFTEGELRAVLIHEIYHLRNRDPLKILLSKSAISLFFFIPVLKDFHKYYSLSKELSADQLALKNESLKNLKSALTKVIGSLNPALNGIAAFASENDLEARVYAIANPNIKTGIKISKLKLLLSLLIVVFVYGVLQLPVHAMENGDGSHSYYILPAGHEHLVSCEVEGDSEEAPFSSRKLYTPLNYSTNH